MTDAAVALLAERGYEPEYGARPLPRLIRRVIDDGIRDLLVRSALGDGEVCRSTPPTASSSWHPCRARPWRCLPRRMSTSGQAGLAPEGRRRQLYQSRTA